MVTKTRCGEFRICDGANTLNYALKFHSSKLPKLPKLPKLSYTIASILTLKISGNQNMVNWDFGMPCSWDFLLLFIIFFLFLRGHQELSMNTSHVIFGVKMSMW